MTSQKPKDDNRLGSRLQETPIAVIGMACLFPEARNAREFWDNIVNKRDSITDVPSNRWDVNDYYDPDPKAPDKTYCKRGGFLPEIDFDPMEFGMPPNILEVTDVSQMLSLVVAKAALEDARYGDSSDFDRDRIGIVLGVGGGQKLITPLTTRLQYPVWKKVLTKSGTYRRGRGDHCREDPQGIRPLGRELLSGHARERHRRKDCEPTEPGGHELRRGCGLRQFPDGTEDGGQ